MLKEGDKSSIYKQPRETRYAIDFGKIFQNENGGQQLAALMADYIFATNLRPDVLVQPHLVRENAESHQEEYHLAESLSKRLNKPAVRFYEYDDGKPEVLEGTQPYSGQRVVIIDGAVRTGETILRTAAHLRKLDNSIVIRDAVVYMLRPEGKKLEALVQRLSNEGIRLHSLISASDLLELLFHDGYITAAQFQEMMIDEDFN